MMYIYTQAGMERKSEHRLGAVLKWERHATILELLSKVHIASQEDLRKKLAVRGFHVTQATLSRDIHDLQLVKGPSGYLLPGSAETLKEDSPGVRQVLEGFGLEVRQALNLLIFVTSTGSAQPVAASIDYEDWPEVVGTIAGDDTVLIICPDERLGTIVKLRIESYLG